MSSDSMYLRTRERYNARRLPKEIKPDPRPCNFCNALNAPKTCTLCKNAVYCSAECQKSDWKTHKRACKNFELPPRKAIYEDGFKQDRIWYCAHDREDGIGFWATERVALVGIQGDRPFDLPDERYHVAQMEEAPNAWKRWADFPSPITAANPSLRAPTLLCLNVLAQNRSQTSVLRVSGYAIYAIVSDAIVNVLTPEEKKSVAPYIDKMHTMGPWVDYAGQRRFQIRSINGVEMPMAKRTKKSKELGDLAKEWPFEDLPRPTEKPFDQVCDWDRGMVNLFPGDYVMFSVQFHVAAGEDLLSTRPAAVGNMPGLGMIYINDKIINQRKAQGISSEKGEPNYKPLPRLSSELNSETYFKHYKTFLDQGAVAYGREEFGAERWDQVVPSA